MKVVGYVRVSLEEEHPENQEFQIREFAKQNSLELIDIVQDVGISGATPPLARPGFSKVVELLSNGVVEGVVVVALDRIARSLIEFFRVYSLFNERGWQIISIRENWLNNLDPKIKPLIITILSWAAEMEREFIRERTREAMARLKAEGKRIGRPPKWTPEVRQKIIDLVRRGVSLKEACRLVGIGYNTALEHLRNDQEYRTAIEEAKKLGLRKR